MGRKHCGKRKNCWLWAISPFSTVFSKDLWYRQVKPRACLERVKPGMSIYMYFDYLCYLLGPYSPTILKDILCLFLQDLKIWMWHNFWLAKPYCLANQKLCYVLMLLNIETRGPRWPWITNLNFWDDLANFFLSLSEKNIQEFLCVYKVQAAPIC